MNEKTKFSSVLKKEILIRGFKKLLCPKSLEHPRRFNGEKVLSPSEGNDALRKALLLKKPFFATRFGDIELRLFEQIEEVRLGLIDKVAEKWRKIAWNNSGMFSIDDEGLEDFYDEFSCAIGKADLLGVWGNLMEDYMTKKFNSHVVPMDLMAYEAFLFDKPWTLGLQGKKVLVINPFAKSIERQYERRDLIFDGRPCLPEFASLQTYIPVVSFGGIVPGDKTWKNALERMHRDIKTLDYEVAIIGCGSYGMPLGRRILEDGKIAIHVGGATQVLFGIRGKRWDERSYMQRIINDYWVRPSEEEKPTVSNRIEGGCYW